VNENTAEVLKHIADKLDVPVAQLWGGIVAYAPFWFYKYVAVVIVGSVLGFALLVVCAKLYDRQFVDGMPCALAGMTGTILLGGSLLFGAVNFGYAMAATTAPQAWASMYIMQLIDRR
jgi:hypothetical protein